MDMRFSRRNLLRAASLAPLAAAGSWGQSFAEVKPKPQQLAWQELEIGVLIHFGPNTFQDREWGDGTADPAIFDPKELDAEQWVLAAKAGGARYLVMVAKHHDGFCLWPSRYTEYSVKNSPWRGGKGDLVKEVEQACRKHGLKFGIYLSPWDRHEPAYKDNAKYDDYYNNQMRELCTRYGELVEIWLDGAGSEGHVYDFDRYVKTLRTYQPNANIFADTGFLQYGDVRWVGNEDGYASEENWNVVDRLGYLRYRPAEADTPLRKAHWFWHPNDEKSLKSLGELVDTYHKTVGRGAQLVLGLAPDNRGLMPESDVARLQEFGEAIRRAYSNPILTEESVRLSRVYAPGREVTLGNQAPWDLSVAEITGTSPYLDAYSPGPQARSAEFSFGLRESAWMDRIVLREGLSDGQTIRRYRIRMGSREEPQKPRIIEGTTIGQKRIELFPRTQVAGVTVSILDAIGPIRIRSIQAFDGSA
jgi:alpha-L-fucosidase